MYITVHVGIVDMKEKRDMIAAFAVFCYNGCESNGNVSCLSILLLIDRCMKCVTYCTFEGFYGVLLENV